jgi:hypothetical protein
MNVMTVSLENSARTGNSFKAYNIPRHAHRKEEEEFMSCPMCRQDGLLGRDQVKIHLFKAHGVGEVFRCEECGDFESTGKAALKRHMRKHHSQQV